MDHVAGPRVGLVADLRAIETRNLPWTWTTPFGRPVVPDVYVSRYGVSNRPRPLAGRRAARRAARPMAPGRRARARAPRADPLQDREHGHLSAARQAPRRDRDLGFGTRSRAAGRRREAREDRHLDRAEMRARVRGDRDLLRHGQKERDAVTNADAELRESLCEARDLIRHLGERQCASPVVLAERDACDRVGRRLRPTMGAVVGNAHLSPDEPGRPFRGPAKGRRRGPTGARTPARCRPLQLGSRDRPANGRRARGGRRCRAGASGGRRSRARALRERDQTISAMAAWLATPLAHFASTC